MLLKMANTIYHRGPNDYGSWYDKKLGIGFAHQRLSILDLSSAGQQPMHSLSGRYVMVFNGEIYNHKFLRSELEKFNLKNNWNGTSDTETLLAGFEAWGIEATIKRSTGMFAIAVWDKYLNNLTLTRDRIGEKPLYYGWQGNTFLFGSELKALKVHPEFKSDIDRNSLSLFIRYNYIPSPYSIYKNIKKLLPGSILTVSLDKYRPKIKSYWSAIDIASKSKKNQFKGSSKDAIVKLNHLLRKTVNQQMLADVPVGAFLSGGIDSSTIVSLMQAQSVRPIKTFSIGFDDPLFNEADHAKAVAKYLGTDHTQLYVTPQDCMDIIKLIPKLYDEPFADSSQIPTYLISSLANQHVKVALSGDAGDEIFGGYNRYQISSKIWKKISLLPLPIRNIMSNVITQISPNNWNLMANSVKKIIPALDNFANIGYKLHKGAGVLGCSSDIDLYNSLVSNVIDPENFVLNSKEKPTILTQNFPALQNLNIAEKMMVLDLITYLPDDILCKVDRASMGASLENRTPFVNHDIVEFAWSLPIEFKLHKNVTKWVLREVLYNYVPKKLVERPKMGFSMPLDNWLRGPLRDWAENLLDESRLSKEGFFNPLAIREKWNEHLSGKKNWQTFLWSILTFQEWLQVNS